MTTHTIRFLHEFVPAILAADPECVRRGIAAAYADILGADPDGAVSDLIDLTAGSHIWGATRLSTGFIVWGSPWPAWAAQVAHGCLAMADPDAYLAARLVEAEAHLLRDTRRAPEPMREALIAGMTAMWDGGLPVPGLPIPSVEVTS